ncbi:hypothetical protein G6F24_018779 [Rhizopus arrhizus]|nr:hypothetical protein G6F24_018779 [Rhizopus arrhizus]
MVALGGMLGQREGLFEGVRLRLGQGGRAGRAVSQQAVDVSTQRGQRIFFLDGAQYVQRNDVAGAFPDGAQMGVAHQARFSPFFDVAAAPAP